MARTSLASKPAEHIRSNGVAISEDTIPTADLELHDGEYKEPAVEPEDLERPGGAPVQRFQVVNGGVVQTQLNGPRSRLIPGKVVDNLNYDIDLLKRQGIQLKEEA